jgi:hypothetical protein
MVHLPRVTSTASPSLYPCTRAAVLRISGARRTWNPFPLQRCARPDESFAGGRSPEKIQVLRMKVCGKFAREALADFFLKR